MQNKKYLWVLVLLIANISAWSQAKIPLIAGAQLEAGAGALPNGYGVGLVRATPFVGAWIDGIGYVKAGFAYWDAALIDSAGVDHGVQQRDLSLQIGSNFGGDGRPYFLASFTRANTLSDVGDVSWFEYGSGIGGFFSITEMSAILVEAEYRWIEKHYDPIQEYDISGTRIQVHVGFVVFFY